MTDTVIEFEPGQNDPGWKPPESVTEVMERALAWAENEERWVYGELFASRSEDSIKPAMQMTCNDVKACSIGILIGVTLNGAALRRFWSGDIAGAAPERELVRHPLGGPAVVCLARGLWDTLPDEGRKNLESGEYEDDVNFSEEKIKTNVIEAKSCVIQINDDMELTDANDLHDHHKKIVNGFERGLALAREYDQTNKEAIVSEQTDTPQDSNDPVPPENQPATERVEERTTERVQESVTPVAPDDQPLPPERDNPTQPTTETEGYPPVEDNPNPDA